MAAQYAATLANSPRGVEKLRVPSITHVKQRRAWLVLGWVTAIAKAGVRSSPTSVVATFSSGNEVT